MSGWLGAKLRKVSVLLGSFVFILHIYMSHILTAWGYAGMVGRGARKFIFLSRSGAASQDARELLAWFESIGVQAIVVKGDVSSKQDVERAVNGSSSTIKGVIQAPLDLHVSIDIRRRHLATVTHSFL